MTAPAQPPTHGKAYGNQVGRLDFGPWDW